MPNGTATIAKPVTANLIIMLLLIAGIISAAFGVVKKDNRAKFAGAGMALAAVVAFVAMMALPKGGMQTVTPAAPVETQTAPPQPGVDAFNSEIIR